ncbi:hypothetical protein BDC45DRAFT_496678 [Circinella umbellata]|nr:hypothetical protein BDC45DRAFT_496678 [Circinella umbellata]
MQNYNFDQPTFYEDKYSQVHHHHPHSHQWDPNTIPFSVNNELQQQYTESIMGPYTELLAASCSSTGPMDSSPTLSWDGGSLISSDNISTITQSSSPVPTLVGPLYQESGFASMVMNSPPLSTSATMDHTSMEISSFYVPPQATEMTDFSMKTFQVPPSPPLSISTSEDIEIIIVKQEDQGRQEKEHKQQKKQKQNSPTAATTSSFPSSHIITTRTSLPMVCNTQTKRRAKHPKQENAYPCQECSKVFTRPYNLKSHQRTHTRERPFVCKEFYCPWKFARPHDLKRHELLHSGVKPHECPHCDKRFARRDALRRHWKVDIQCGQEAERLSIVNAAVGRRRGAGKAGKVIK